MFHELLYVLCVIGMVLGQNEDDIFPTLPLVLRKSENVVCKQHSEEYLDNLKNFTIWAYEMRDASAKSTTSVLRGSTFNMGDFSQCLTSRAPFPTQYCLAVVAANVPHPKTTRNPFSLQFDPNDSLLDKLYRYEDISKLPRNVVKLGWCIPASCTPLEAEKYLNEYFSKLDYPLREENVTYTAHIPPVLCTSSNAWRGVDYGDVVFCILTAILILLVVAATILEYNNKFEKSVKGSFLFRIFLAFSAKKNFNDLNKSESQDDSLAILYGIKTFSIFMIIVDHRFGYFVVGPVSNFDYIEEMYRNTLVSYIFHGDLFVDTFFVVSGLLVGYNLLSLFDKKTMNPAFIIFMRYMRLTPAYAFILFFTTTIFYHTGSGALWNGVIGTEVADCKRNWWTNVLYVSNYVDAEHMCLAHTWYLPCDFHYFIVAVGIILLIKKERRYGLSALLALTLISIIVPFIIILVENRAAFLRFYPDFLAAPKTHPDYIFYTNSHNRATPYFIGAFAGYIYYKQKGSGRILSKWYTTTLVFISGFLLLVCMYSGIVFYDPFHAYNALESAIYGCLHRPIWALGTFGIMYAVSYGTYTFLYKCLAWSPWVPLSKLVYGAYLWHFLLQMRSMAKVNSPLIFNFFDVGSYALGDICLSFMLALGLYLTVEAPVRRIIKEILMPNKPKKTESKKEADPQVPTEDSRL